MKSRTRETWLRPERMMHDPGILVGAGCGICPPRRGPTFWARTTATGSCRISPIWQAPMAGAPVPKGHDPMPDESLPVIAQFEVRRRAYLAADGTVRGRLPEFASDL